MTTKIKVKAKGLWAIVLRGQIQGIYATEKAAMDAAFRMPFKLTETVHVQGPFLVRKR